MKDYIELIKKANHIYIYGGGERAERFLPICEAYKSSDEIDVIVTDNDKEENLSIYTIKSFSEITVDEDDVIFLAMGEQHWNSVLENIERHCKCTIECLSEETINQLMKKACIDNLKKIGIDIRLFPNEWRKDIYSNNVFDNSGSIEKKMWELATKEAAEYVMDNMDQAKMFHHKSEYHEWLMSQLDISRKTDMCLEFGVYAGKSLNLFSTYCKLHFYGFDSFEGLPSDWMPGFDKGRFSLGCQLPSVRENVTLISGWFEQSLPTFVQEHDLKKEKIKFIHIDCDLYSSTKTVFQYIGPFIEKGTIIAFDEYFNYPAWKKHEYKVFKEWVDQNNIKYEYIAYVENGSQVAVRIL